MNSEQIELVVQKAKEAMELSYSPYSKFPVGAAILTKDGNIFQGTNIENASYPLGMCGERNAIYNAMCHGYKKDDLLCLAIVGNSPNPISPCGACRQVISELYPAEAPIVLVNTSGERKITTIKELLPFAFSGEDL